MATTAFNLKTKNTPSLDGVFSVDVDSTSHPSPFDDGPHSYDVRRSNYATYPHYWDGKAISFQVTKDDVIYSFIGSYNDQSDPPFSGGVRWKRAPEGEVDDSDTWTATTHQGDDGGAYAGERG